MRSKHTKFFFLGPPVVIILATIAYPLLYALVTSFRHWELDKSFAPEGFVGLENYQRVFQDLGFFNSLKVTITYSIMSVSLTLVIALAIAFVLQGPGKLKMVLKTTLILPFAVAPALKGFSWRFMLNEEYGIYDLIADALLFFVPGNIVWLAEPFWALLAITLSEVWGWAPLFALMFIGALGSIDPEINEAAEVDGATNWRLFREITLPLLTPVILVAALLKTIYSLKLIDQVITMTSGGPGHSTETLSYYIYRMAFTSLDMGYASALAWVLVLILGTFAVVYIKALTGKDDM